MVVEGSVVLDSESVLSQNRLSYGTFQFTLMAQEKIILKSNVRYELKGSNQLQNILEALL